LHPHLREQIGRMWIGGSSKIARTAEVLRVQAGLFGSGSAGLGSTRKDGTRWRPARHGGDNGRSSFRRSLRA
jgi:hypothetical protein